MSSELQLSSVRHEPLLLEALALRRSFAVHGGRLHALRGVTLQVQAGQTVGLVGESGCGKSTLARCLIGLEPFDEGRVLLEGQELAGYSRRQIARRVQIMLQDSPSALDPRLTVQKIVAEPLSLQRELTATERLEQVAQVLAEVGLPENALDRYPHEFSGGQRQRISLARALVGRPKLLIADEPASSLDTPVQVQMTNLLTRLQRENRLGLLLISHDLGLVLHLCQRVLVMYLGVIVEEGPAEEVASQPQHPYTRALLEAIPELSPGRRGHRQILRGEPPSPLAPPSGCPFHPRCPLYALRRGADCVSQAPALAQQGNRRVACHESDRD